MQREPSFTQSSRQLFRTTTLLFAFVLAAISPAAAVQSSSLNPVALSEYDLSWAGVHHLTRADGSEVDRLSVGISGADDFQDDLIVEVSGPDGFSYSFSSADLAPWLPDTLALVKDYSQLPAGHYTFTISDAEGGRARQVDLHQSLSALPAVDTATLQFQRQADGSYRFSWAPVDPGATAALYYRLRVTTADGAPLYVGGRIADALAVVPAGVLPNGQPCLARVDVSDGPSFDLEFNRTDSASLPFTPFATDYQPGRLTVSYARAYNRVEAGAAASISFSFAVNNAAAITLAELDGPGGFHYTFNLTGDLLPQFNEFSTSVAPGAAAPGRYTFHFVANGIDHYAYALLTEANPLPAPDATTWTAEDLGNGTLRLRWADVYHSGALYYRAAIRNPANGLSYLTARLNQTEAYINFTALESAIGSGAKEWRVEVFDGPALSTARNRTNGTFVPFSVIPFDPAAPAINSAYVQHRRSASGASLADYWFNAWDADADLVELRVDGPGNLQRDLLLDGRLYINPSNQGYQLLEAGSPAAGRYTFTAIDSGSRQTRRYDVQPEPIPLPSVDYRTLHVDATADGGLRVSWAPVICELPLWYALEVFTLSDHNGDSQMDRAYSQAFQTVTSVRLPPGTLPEEPLMLRVRAMDGISIINNRSNSVMVGLESPGFAYASLADVDGDGYASNVDPDDTNPNVYPFSGQSLTPLNDTTEFVKQLYRDFLNREGDEGGIAYWVNRIDGQTATHAAAVESFLLSEEFGQRISPVVRLYFAYFLRIPDYDGLMYWVGRYATGTTLEEISSAFAGSPEFQSTYGSLSNEQFVQLVYQNVLGRQPDEGGLAFWTGELDSGHRSRGQVMAGFSESAEYAELTGNPVYVTMTYMGLLRRAPDQGGFDYWVGRMDSGDSGQILIDGFLASAEYAGRF